MIYCFGIIFGSLPNYIRLQVRFCAKRRIILEETEKLKETEPVKRVSDSRRRSRKRGGNLPLLPLLLVLLLGALIFSLWYLRFGPSRVRIGEAELFGASGDEVAVIYDYELQKEKAVMRDGSVYLPLSLVKSAINQRFYWDRDEKLIVYAAPTGVRKFTAEEKDTEGKVLYYTEDQELYLSLPLLREFTDVRIESYLDGSVKRIFIAPSPESDEVRAAKHKLALRSRPSVRGSIVTEVKKNEALRVIPDHEGATTDTTRWTRVKTESGFTGYVQLKNLRAAETVPYTSNFTKQEYPSLALGEKVLLGFHLVSNQAANKGLGTLAQNASGMNVIVPTWFSLRGNEGDYQNFADRAYVEEAHEKGLKVFALLDNFDKTVTTGELLKKTSVREKLIQSLISDADLYGYDGINVDLELIKEEAIDQYLEFIRELSLACHEKQLYLTVDVPNPASFNLYYDRKELAVFCDYVINMGYDEHTKGDEPGSTASLGFVTTGLDMSLAEVPAEKLIQAVPFYTRLWTEDKNGKVSSEALGMKGAKEWVEKNQVGLNYDETLGQNYGQRSNNGSLQLIWMEDAKSMQTRMDVIKSKSIAGVAVWRLGLETDDVWEIIKQ